VSIVLSGVSLWLTPLFLRYIRDRTDQKLRQCINKLSELETEIQRVEEEVERLRALVQKQDNDVSAAGADLANLRENLRLRKLQREIQETKDFIKSLKLEEASKAKEQFEEKWGKVKAAEHEAQARVRICLLISETSHLSLVVLTTRGRAEFPTVSTRDLGDGSQGIHRHQQALYRPACES
jgi:septal ring factor EnvC (AmiA/AmiB activator)